MVKYASIVPLIGGETIAMQNVFGSKPEYILSYTPFQANDSQLLSYYGNEVPYHLLDDKTHPAHKNPGGCPWQNVDVVNSVCPCAGLSSLSPSASSTNKANDWMVETAKFVLNEVKPEVLWGENAPRLASKMGEPVVEQLREIAKENGYTFSLYKTKSILHGLSQVRDRSFYFFWKGDRTPLLPYYHRPNHEKIEDTIRNAFVSDDDPMNELTNKTTPTDNPFYQFILSEIEPGCTHQDIQKKIKRSINVMDYIESHGIKYNTVSKWMKEHGHDKVSKRCDTIYEKLERGGNIMRKLVEIPKDSIGAFVGHLPTQLTHPDEDRFLSIRECMHIMKMPKDFNLQGGLKNLNMICQNVPVTTATDMAEGVKQYLLGNLDTISTNFLVQDNRNHTHEDLGALNTLENFF
jgi:site-specific DNA-cytosine methylase